MATTHMQTSVNFDLGRGVNGEFSDMAVKEGRAFIVKGTDAEPTKAYVGKLYSIVDVTVDAGTSDKMTVAKQGVGIENARAFGILVNPKEHFTHGFQSQRYVDANTAATIATKGHIWVIVDKSVTAGGAVYAMADGTLTPAADNGKEGEAKVSYKLVKGAMWLRTVAVDEAHNGEELAEVAINNVEVAA